MKNANAQNCAILQKIGTWIHSWESLNSMAQALRYRPMIGQTVEWHGIGKGPSDASKFMEEDSIFFN